MNGKQNNNNCDDLALCGIYDVLMCCSKHGAGEYSTHAHTVYGIHPWVCAN